MIIIAYNRSSPHHITHTHSLVGGRREGEREEREGERKG